MAKHKLKILQTPCGVRFGLRGEYSAPAPTLFVFAKSLEESLHEKDYFEVGEYLLSHGYLCVSLDLPDHEKSAPSDEPQGLDGWRARLERGENFMSPFTEALSRVLDYLIEQGYTDGARVAACGTSRGGFVALHFAAADERVQTVAAFAPVVDLAPVPGFAGIKENPTLRSLALKNYAQQLTETAIWISIGNDDAVVDTDLVIDFSRQVVAARAGKSTPANIELHVLPTPGHTTPRGAHRNASLWLQQQMQSTPAGSEHE